MTTPETRLDENDKALDRMQQERASPGRDTRGGDAKAGDFEGTDPRRGDRQSDHSTTPSPLPTETDARKGG